MVFGEPTQVMRAATTSLPSFEGEYVVDGETRHGSFAFV
jgi:hypothetical protein